METFTLAELGVFIGILGSVITTFLLTCQKSKCETINLRKCICQRIIRETSPPAIVDEEDSPLQRTDMNASGTQN
jgi:hypothetical protein